MIERYLLRSFILPLVYCLVIFLFMYVIIDLFGHLTDIIKSQTTLTSVILYYLCLLPLVFVQTAPIAVLLATIFALSTLNRNNEIIAMRSSGISTLQILSPFLITGLLVSLAVFIVNDQLATQTNTRANKIKEEQIERSRDIAPPRAMENIAFYGNENRVFYARTFNTEEQTLDDLIIFEHDAESNLKRKIMASRVQWSGSAWIFQNGIMYDTEPNGKMIGKPVYFQSREYPIPEKPADFLHQRWHPETMSYKELHTYLKHFPDRTLVVRKRLEVELHQRISFPLISFFAAFLGAPLALRWRRGGVMLGIGIAVGISFFLYGVMAIFLALGKAGAMPPLLASWAPNVISFALGLHFIKDI